MGIIRVEKIDCLVKFNCLLDNIFIQPITILNIDLRENTEEKNDRATKDLP